MNTQRVELRDIDINNITSVAACRAAQDRVLAALTSIKSQMEMAEREASDRGVRSDPDWLRRVGAARRHAARMHQRLLQLGADLAKRERASQHAERCAAEATAFYEVVSESVDHETFVKWKQQAQERAAERMTRAVEEMAL